MSCLKHDLMMTQQMCHWEQRHKRERGGQQRGCTAICIHIHHKPCSNQARGKRIKMHWPHQRYIYFLFPPSINADAHLHERLASEIGLDVGVGGRTTLQRGTKV